MKFTDFYEDLDRLAQDEVNHGTMFDDKTDDNDKIDTVTVDIPLLIRLFEYCREELDSDVALHDMVERMLDIKNEILTMDEYDEIVGQ